MMWKNQMRISEFAKVTGISRKNLIFYDKMGLLSPAMVNQQNNYRYYTYQQIDTVNVITILREIGMPLKEIKAYLQERSPQRLTDMLTTQKSIVQDKIRTLIQISDMLDTRIDLTAKGRNADVNSIVLTESEAVPILLGPELPADGHMSEGWYYLVDFYEFCRENKVILGLPTGAIVAHADLINRNTTHLSNYYYRPLLPSGYPTNAFKPGGLYLVGWEYTEYANSSRLYRRLFEYIEEAGLKLCGNAYEEYLLDEISTPDPSQYLLQIAVHVHR